MIPLRCYHLYFFLVVFRAGYVRGGVGERVERIYRDVRAFAIPGGAEEILGDFAIRSSAKKAKKISKL